MTDGLDTSRPEAELQKLRLEIQKLTLDVASARKFARLDSALRLLPTATILVTVLGFMFSVWQYRAEQAKNREASVQQAANDATERAERARKDTETAQREFMRPLLEKQQELYFDAATAAATIASSKDAAERRKAESKFWILYRGPLVMVESTDVSGAMKKFGRCLTDFKPAEDNCDAGELHERSLALASTLETSMLKTWNAKPDEFIKGQFVYR